MKKYLFSMLAMATLLFAASCSQEEDFRGNSSDEVTVSFSVDMPTVATRAANGANVDELVCVVFETVNGVATERYREEIAGNNRFTFTPQLINGRTYDIVFWAHKNGAYEVTDIRDIRRIVVDGAAEGDYDAFTFVEKNFKVTDDNLSKNVTLRRPFAQLNIGVTDADLQKVIELGYTPTEVVITVDNSATHFNALTGLQNDSEKTVSYTLPVPGEKITVAGTEYNLLSQCFVFLEQGWPNANVTYVIKGGAEVITEGSFQNVPFDANYKTNIVGTLMTEQPVFNITIDAAFEDDDKVYSVWGGESVAPINYDDATKTYVLESAANLAWLADAVNGTLGTRADAAQNFEGFTFKLDCDIDLAGINWTPIGHNGVRFHGNFDGQGHTIKNLTIKEINNGIYQAALFGDVAGTTSFKNVVFDKANITYTPENCTNPEENFYASALLATGYGNITIENVTVKNSTFKGNNKVAAIFAHDAATSSVKINNCRVENSRMESVNKADGGNVAAVLAVVQCYDKVEVSNTAVVGNTVVGINASNSGKRANGLIVGSLLAGTDAYKNQELHINNVTVEGNTFTQTTNGTDPVTYVGFGSELVGGKRYDTEYGKVYVDGVELVLSEENKNVIAADGTRYSTIAEAIAAGKNEITLAAGEFAFPETIGGGKDITISGADKNGTVVSISATSEDVQGGVISFKNLTMKRNVVGNNNYAKGYLANLKQENYENCIIEGCVRIGISESATFNNCEFRNNTVEGFGGYAVHYYSHSGSKVTFNDCTFNTAGKAICVYHEQALVFNLEVNRCTFNASQETDKAAIQMHTETGISGTLVVNESKATGFADVNGGLWNEVINSGENKGTATYNFVKIIDGVTIVADGVTINAEGAYEISKVAGLKWLRNQVNESSNTFKGKTVLLTEDMDLAGELWEPIGLNADAAKKFMGTFDGQNHVISNLKVERAAAYQAAGFFGALNGIAKNFSIVNADVDALSSGDATDNGIAVVAGSIYASGTIENVTVDNATVDGNRYVGGIAGFVYGNIKNCTVTNSTFVATPDNLTGKYDNGDKAGAIAGYFVENGNFELTGNVAKNVTVKAYRDLGVIAGTANGADKVYGNTVEGANTLVVDRTNWYGKKDENAGEFVGRITAGILGENTITGVVTIERIMPDYIKENGKYTVYTAKGLAEMNSMFIAKSTGRDVVMELGADIDFTGYTWTPVDSHADTNFTIKEINGNGCTISNLTVNGQAMFTRFAGSGNVVVKDITFDNAKVNNNGINTAILVGHSYQNVLLDNVDVKNSSVTGGYKVATFIGTVYNENESSTVTATLKNCDVDNVTVKAITYDFCTTGMVAFVYADNNEKIEFENCSVKNLKLMAPNSYSAHAWIYTTGSDDDTLYNSANGVTVEESTCSFENI